MGSPVSTFDVVLPVYVSFRRRESMNSRFILVALLLGVSFLTSQSVLSEATDEAKLADANKVQQETRDNILANLYLPDGSIVQFHEPIQGEIVIFTQSPIKRSDRHPSKAEEVDVKKFKDLDPLGIYNMLSGGLEAPRALVEAQQRMEMMQQKYMEPLQAPQTLIDEDVIPESEADRHLLSSEHHLLTFPDI
jgi:hypothetical protein